MRQIISTALVAVIVSLLTVTAVGVLAQDEPTTTERAITPAAGINAASVDGKSAVGYTNKRGQRVGKLVATNAKGELPSNIVRPYWGFIKNKPGILADHQITWNEVSGKPATLADGEIRWGEVANKPAAFADGTDDVGHASEVVYSGHLDLADSRSMRLHIDLDKRLDVQVTVIPATVGGDIADKITNIVRLPNDVLRRNLYIVNNGPVTDFNVRVRVFGTGLSDAALKNLLKSATVRVQ